MGFGKLNIEIGLVMVLAIMWLSSPVSIAANNTTETLPCWEKVVKCLNATFNETTILDLFDPQFNTSHTLCCTTMKQQAKADKECFCKGSLLMTQFSHDYSEGMNQWFSECNITAPVEAFCSGAFGVQIGWVMLVSTLFIVCSSILS